MPPNIGQRGTAADRKGIPTVDRSTGTSSLPDKAFDIEAYTRELRVDRRDLSSVYGGDDLPAAIQRSITAQEKKLRATKAGPVQCPRHEY